MKKIAVTLAALCTVLVLGSPAQAQTGNYCPNNGYNNQQYSQEQQAEILRAYLTIMYMQQMQQNAQQGGNYYNQGYQGNYNPNQGYNNQSNGSYFNHSNATGVSSGGDSSGFYISGPGFSYSNF